MDTKTCPDCAEEVKAQARVCRYCGYRFEGAEPEAVKAVDVPESEPPPGPVTPLVSEGAPPGPRERRWPRDLGYAAAIAFWIFAVIPLGARLGRDNGYSAAGNAASGLGIAVLVSLGIAAAIRGLYAKLRKRRFWSPWLYAIAGLIAFFSYAGQVASDEERVNKAAVERGVAESANNVTPVQRCVTKALDEMDRLPPEQRALIPADARSFLSRACAMAEREAVLATTGDVYSSEAFKLAVCTEGMLNEFDKIPRAQRAFTRADFAIFGQRYCDEALSRGFGAGTSRAEIEALQDQVLEQLVESGQITRIR